MQAIILFVLFGLVSAVFGGIIGLTTESTVSLIQRQVDAQKKIFNDVVTVVNGWTVPQFFESINSDSTTNPAIYVCAREELKMLASCADQSGNLVMQDVWGRPVTGFQKRFNNVAFSSRMPAGVFSVQGPVTGYVLVSAGPDGKIDGRLQTDLGNLGSSSSLNEILRIQAYRSESTPASADDSLDDVVLTFSDRLAQEKNFSDIQDSLNRIAIAALQNYNIQFRQYQSNLASVYANAFSGNSPIVIDDNTMTLWQTASASNTLPAFSVSNYSRMGIEADRQTVERLAPSGHFNLNIQTALSGQALDIFMTTTSGFVWSFPSSPNCATSVPSNCIRVKVGS